MSEQKVSRVAAFGPSALATPANAITLARLAMTPVLLALIVHEDGSSSWPLVLLWILLAVTDGADGWVARRQGTTRSGAFLDPLADKFLVIGAMVALVAQDRFWWFPVAIVAVREVAVSLYRAWAGRRGVSVPARPLAKAKTVVQEVAIGFALLPLTAEHHPAVARAVLWIAVVLTVVSGAQYLIDDQRLRARPPGSGHAL